MLESNRVVIPGSDAVDMSERVCSRESVMDPTDDASKHTIQCAHRDSRRLIENLRCSLPYHCDPSICCIWISLWFPNAVCILAAIVTATLSLQSTAILAGTWFVISV